MPPRDLLAQIAANLAAAGIENARSEAWLLLAAASGRERVELIAGVSVTLSADQRARLEELVRRRCAREPLAYVLGEKEFWSLPFEVGPAVLIPRPETETVVEAVLAQLPERDRPLRLLDLGVGSGCLLLALLSELPQATGLGVDDSSAALALARRNAERLGLAARADFRQGHWGEGVRERFDVIVSNPPYVAERDWDSLQPEIGEFEPKAALVAGPDGLAAYRAMAPECARLLEQGGLCALEIGFAQGDPVAALVAAQGLLVTERRRDLAGIERVVVARIRREIHGAFDTGRLWIRSVGSGLREVAMADRMVTPDELRRITDEQEMAKAREALEKKRKADDAQDQVREAFMAREIHPDVFERLSRVVKSAAERGEREVLALRFSSEYCTDGGRAINSFEPDWPNTLTGFAKRAHEFWQKELEPNGYKVRAQIMDFPGGMPGDVGIFLRW